METRIIQQAHLYFLCLNTFGSAEAKQIRAVATSEEALKKWYDEQKLEQPINIDGWIYSFKEGSPIRTNNPLYSWRNCNEDIFGHGWFRDWVDLSDLRTDIYRVDF